MQSNSSLFGQRTFKRVADSAGFVALIT